MDINQTVFYIGLFLVIRGACFSIKELNQDGFMTASPFVCFFGGVLSALCYIMLDSMNPDNVYTYTIITMMALCFCMLWFIAVSIIVCDGKAKSAWSSICDVIAMLICGMLTNRATIGWIAFIYIGYGLIYFIIDVLPFLKKQARIPKQEMQ